MLGSKNIVSGSTLANEVEEDCRLKLLLHIHHAEDIDNLTNNRHINYRFYSVRYWVEPWGWSYTKVVEGLPNPFWDQIVCIHLLKPNKPTDNKFLCLEVVRFLSDPGTSDGLATVGRVRIPIPDISVKVEGRFGLVKLTESGFKGEGHIILAMQLIKVYADY